MYWKLSNPFSNIAVINRHSKVVATTRAWGSQVLRSNLTWKTDNEADILYDSFSVSAHNIGSVP
jgi:hypothetical protein